MQSGGGFGMRTMDSAIQALLDAGRSPAPRPKESINKAQFEEIKAKT